MSSAEVTDTIMAEVSAPTSISEAAHQYQLAMSQQEATPPNPTTTEPIASVIELSGDPAMNGNNSEMNESPIHVASTAANAPSPAPPRTGTPIRRENNPDVSSRATSQHPDPVATMPAEAPPHGAPTRQYLNSRVTGVLLEGLKFLAKEQPKDPLRVLSEFLMQRSKELEGT